MDAFLKDLMVEPSRVGLAKFSAKLLRCCSPFAVLILFSACASPPHRAEFDGSMPVQDCPEQFNGLVSLSGEALPIALPDSLVRDGIAQTSGQFARRIVISAAANGALRADRITWSTLSLSTFGGTFRSWTALQTPFTVVDALKPATVAALPPVANNESAEAASVMFAPGQIKVIRSARGRTDLAGTLALDVVVMPGGIEVDHTVLRVTQLWTKDGAPLPTEAVEFELAPARHPPGYDVVEMGMELKFIVRVGKRGDEWSCAAESRVTLVDEDAIRQPLWDIGVASTNGGRSKWLAVSDPAAGVIRLIFESPSAANAFASWVKMTRATAFGRYSLGVFERPASRSRTFSPLEPEAMQTFRPITPADVAQLRVGALGER